MMVIMLVGMHLSFQLLEGIYIRGFITVIFNGQHPFNVDQEYEFVYSFNRSNNVNKFYIDGTLINSRTVAVNTDNRSTSYLFLGDDNPGCCANTSN